MLMMISMVTLMTFARDDEWQKAMVINIIWRNLPQGFGHLAFAQALHPKVHTLSWQRALTHDSTPSMRGYSSIQWPQCFL